jgi:hypothetical protein
METALDHSAQTGKADFVLRTEIDRLQNELQVLYYIIIFICLFDDKNKIYLLYSYFLIYIAGKDMTNNVKKQQKSLLKESLR